MGWKSVLRGWWIIDARMVYTPKSVLTHLSDEGVGLWGCLWVYVSCLIPPRVLASRFMKCMTRIIMHLRRRRLKGIHYIWMIFSPSICITYTAGVGKSGGRMKNNVCKQAFFVGRDRVKISFCCYCQPSYIYDRFAVLAAILGSYFSTRSSSTLWSGDIMASSGEFLYFHFYIYKISLLYFF